MKNQTGSLEQKNKPTAFKILLIYNREKFSEKFDSTGDIIKMQFREII